MSPQVSLTLDVFQDHFFFLLSWQESRLVSLHFATIN